MTDQGPRPSKDKQEPLARPINLNPKGPYSGGPYGGGPKPDRRRRWTWIALGVVVAAVILWVVAPHGPTAPAGGAAGAQGGGRRGGGGRGGAPTAVGVATATKGDVPLYIFGLGTATPTETVTVRTQISGQLLSVAFREGQNVVRGQALAQVDPRPYQALLQQAQGQLARDQALLDNARIDLKRYQTLLSQDSIASQQVDTQKALVHQYEGTIKSDEAGVATQRLNLTYCRITSPVTGRVGLRQVDPGNYVSAGDTNGIVVVTQVDPMDVLFTVPEDSLPQIGARLRSGAALETVAFDRTQQQQLAVGKLLTLDNQVDTTTGTVRAKARFDNHTGALFPNQFVNVRLLVDSLKGTIIVPTAAILKGSQGLFVYVVGSDTPPLHTVEVRPIKTGPAAGENTAITSGLDEGEIVVTDGSDRLRDGQTVILPGDCIPAGMGASGGGRRGGRGSGGGQSGGAGAFGAVAKPEGKTLFNLFGLIKGKPLADPMAAMRCKPGQSSGGAVSPPAVVTTSTAVTATTTRVIRRTAPSTGEAAPTPAPSPTAPTVSPNAGASGAGAPQPGGSAKEAARRARFQAMYAPLNLDPGQQEKMAAIMAAGRPKMMAAFQSGDMAAAKAARDDMNKQVDAVLRPDQRVKMAEIRARMQAERGGGGGRGPQ